MTTNLDFYLNSDATPSTMAEITAALQNLDAIIAAQGLAIWIGGEPTFTDRFSQAPEWISAALGETKNAQARELAKNAAVAFPGTALLRTVGHQYYGETAPRWNLGLLGRRDGLPAWEGPTDPLLAKTACPVPPDPSLLRQALEKVLLRHGWGVVALDSPTPPRHRLLARHDGSIPDIGKLDPEQLYRPTVHATRVPDTGLSDNLAQNGYALVLFDILKFGSMGWLTVELPGLADSNRYLSLLNAVAEAAVELELTALAICGYPPPSDRHLCWHTITPDPAVIEISMAPSVDLTELFTTNQALFNAASTCGLYPYRLHYNGREVDSGGGGQMTIGGPTPDASPFFLEPQLLPRLIRYFNNHPALSYWFTSESVGCGSQAPRTDEGPRERWLELAVALEQIEHRTFPDPAFIWSTLAPVLVDSTGNSHRCELNIEKLWNPHLGARGLLGLVEMRPLRMAHDAATFTATAALLRAIIARLMQHQFADPLIDWGDQLHGRFALPYHLTLDLQQVFADLAAHGFGLGKALTSLLLDDTRRKIRHLIWQDIDIKVSSALEFWPLLGDVSTQQQSDSRLIDSSTSRIELRLQANAAHVLEGWTLEVNGFDVPLVTVAETPQVRVMGIRYRSFVPHIGLHPHMPAIDKVAMLLKAPGVDQALALTLTEWRPQGGAYPGLPLDLEDARLRRKERLVVAELPISALPEAKLPRTESISDTCFDLRRA